MNAARRAREAQIPPGHMWAAMLDGIPQVAEDRFGSAPAPGHGGQGTAARCRARR
jgi:hypothetical protein